MRINQTVVIESANIAVAGGLGVRELDALHVTCVTVRGNLPR
jgi:hypothetical protein